MNIQSIMTSDPLTLRDGETVARAEDALLAKAFINLPVVDARSRYLGMFGVFELLRALTPKAPSTAGCDDIAALRHRLSEIRLQLVGPLVNNSLPVLRANASITEALPLFHLHRSSLPVVDAGNGRLSGIVSYWDALGAITAPPK